MSDIRVVEDDLSGPEIAALLGEHLASMQEYSPACSVHALDIDALRDPAVTFFSAWVLTPEGADLAGCGALRELTPTEGRREGEVKSMRTASSYLRRGVAAAVLARLLEVAAERGYARVSLETGTGPAFEAAHALYERHGFEPCGPFGDYPGAAGGAADPFSRFLSLQLR